MAVQFMNKGKRETQIGGRGFIESLAGERSGNETGVRLEFSYWCRLRGPERQGIEYRGISPARSDHPLQGFSFAHNAVVKYSRAIRCPPPFPTLSPMSDARSKSSVTEDEKAHGALVTSRDVDVGAELIAGKDIHLDPEEALRLR